MGGWYREECCYWLIDNKRVFSMWLYWIWWRNFKFTSKITRNNQEMQSSRGGNSRSKRISGRNVGFATSWRVASRGSWIKPKLHSQGKRKRRWNLMKIIIVRKMKELKVTMTKSMTKSISRFVVMFDFDKQSLFQHKMWLFLHLSYISILKNRAKEKGACTLFRRFFSLKNFLNFQWPW